MTNDEFEVKSWVSGLKWCNIPRFLKSLAWDLNLEIKILERDRGFIRETVYFQLNGTRENIIHCLKNIELSAKGYNGK